MRPSEMTSSSAAKWVVGVLAALLLLSLQAGWRLRSNQVAARTVEWNWRDCRQLADQIADLRRSPTLAALDNQTQQELSKSIADVVSEAGAAPNVVRSIDPQPAKMVTNTSYQQQTTQIELQSIELATLVTIIQSLVTRHAGLHLTSIELKPASAQAVGEQRWNVALLFTRLVYTEGRRSAG